MNADPCMSQDSGTPKKAQKGQVWLKKFGACALRFNLPQTGSPHRSMMMPITVGEVAGLIAALIPIVNVLTPTALTFVLSAILCERNSAATWTVAGQALARSYWPFLLRTDGVQSHGVRRHVRLLNTTITLMSYLIFVAGIVTPLGLYQALNTSAPIKAQFQSAVDRSAFGSGTLPSSNLSFSRICSMRGMLQLQLPCPFSDTETIVISYGEGGIVDSSPYGYNTTIPQHVLDTFSSGTKNEATLSNFFDIQYRQYMPTQDPSMNNGSNYLVGISRFSESLILNSGYQAVEGLVVDLDRGGVGFRDHTFPTGFPNGVSWSEDLLFIEPETVCVDTNLTLDYTVVAKLASVTGPVITDVVLTDRGGISRLYQTFLEANITDAQNDPDLYGRAYKAAWINNAYTAVYYNVTDMNDPSLNISTWSYLDSYVGKTFPLQLTAQFQGGGVLPALSINTSFGTYLGLDSTAQWPQNFTAPPNPFNINSTHFQVASNICQDTGRVANISNVMILCGLMSGSPRRQDGRPGVIFESGSNWTQPLYACASALKATIKTVSFTFNGSGDSLQRLSVYHILDKSDDGSDDVPLWAVERTSVQYDPLGINLVWGLVSSDYEGSGNVSTVRKNSLYLPGDSTFYTSSYNLYSIDNLPGAEFYTNSMVGAYSIGTSSSSAPLPVDYTGQTNNIMFQKWQNITRFATTAGLVPNLIWTDYAASFVRGTKGLSNAEASVPDTFYPLVTPIVEVVGYNYLYGIPAFLAGAGLLLAVLAALGTVLFHKHSVNRLRLHIQQTSAGRIFTTLLDPERSSFGLKAKTWARNIGDVMIDPSGRTTMMDSHLKVLSQMKHSSDVNSSVIPISGNASIETVQGPAHSQKARDDEGDVGMREYGEAVANPEPIHPEAINPVEQGRDVHLGEIGGASHPTLDDEDSGARTVE